MLRITQSKSAQQAKSYYVSGLSREDYYSEGQEVAGDWHGKGAERLGLAGKVDQEAFYALSENRDPATGDRLTARSNDERTIGYDFKAWGGGGGGGTGGNAGGGGDYETVSIGSSKKSVTYFLSVGGGGGSGNYMTGGVGGSGVTGFSGNNGSWHVGIGGTGSTGGGGAASGVWTDGLGTGKSVLIATGGKGSLSDAEICETVKTTAKCEKCVPATGGGSQSYPPTSDIGSETESPGNPDDTDRPSGAGEGGGGVSSSEHNASAGNDGAIHWATCEAAPCQQE